MPEAIDPQIIEVPVEAGTQPSSTKEETKMAFDIPDNLSTQLATVSLQSHNEAMRRIGAAAENSNQAIQAGVALQTIQTDAVEAKGSEKILDLAPSSLVKA